MNQLVRLLRDARLLIDSTGKSVESQDIASGRIRVAPISVLKLELEVKKMKRRLLDVEKLSAKGVVEKTGVAAVKKVKDRMEMSTELSFQQFFELIPQIVPLIISGVTGPEVQLHAEALLRESIVKNNAKREELAIASFKCSTVNRYVCIYNSSIVFQKM